MMDAGNLGKKDLIQELIPCLGKAIHRACEELAVMGEKYRMPGFLAWEAERMLVRSQGDKVVWQAEEGVELGHVQCEGACDSQADVSTRPCLIDSWGSERGPRAGDQEAERASLGGRSWGRRPI